MPSGNDVAAAAVLPETLTPLVTIVVPCRNEAAFVQPALRSLLEGSWPADRIELLVIDGESTDGTRALVEQLACRDPRVRLLDNPRRITPAALNLGVRAARGDVIVRADAHAIYPPEFVAAQVRALEAGADMAGCAAEHVPARDTAICRAIACALGHPFATGSPFRFRRKSGPSDAAALGCWRKDLFRRVGLFDERLLRNQDNEHSARILHRGGRVHLCADVRVRYYPRQTLQELMRQGAQNGTWNAFTQRLHPYTFRLRHFLPGLFFLGVLAAATLALAGVVLADHAVGAWLVLAAAALVAPYALANLAASAWLAFARRRLSFLVLLPVIFAGFHLAYGFGIVRGWLLVATGGWRSRLGKGGSPGAEEEACA